MDGRGQTWKGRDGRDGRGQTDMDGRDGRGGRGRTWTEVDWTDVDGRWTDVGRTGWTWTTKWTGRYRADLDFFVFQCVLARCRNTMVHPPWPKIKILIGFPLWACNGCGATARIAALIRPPRAPEPARLRFLASVLRLFSDFSSRNRPLVSSFNKKNDQRINAYSFEHIFV